MIRGESKTNYWYKNTKIFEDEYGIYNLVSYEPEKKIYIMMEWERELMKAQAEIASNEGWDVLEIGFGMGISANYIIEKKPKSYTIVEIHPEIIRKVKKWMRDKPYVTLIEGDWFDNLDLITQKKYDGIFFDTHNDENADKFREKIVEKSIKPNGVFTYFDYDGFDTYGYGKELNILKVNKKFEVPDVSQYATNTVQFHAPYVWYKDGVPHKKN